MKKIGYLIVLVAVLFLNCLPESLSAPVLVSPANNEIVSTNPPVFIWRTVVDADFYWLQVAGNENFSNLVIDISCTADTVYAPADTFAPGEYYWRVLGEESG